MNGQSENQSSRLMKTIEEGSIVDDDSITAYPKLSKLPKKVESNRKFDFFTNSLIHQIKDLLFAYRIEQLTKKVKEWQDVTDCNYKQQEFEKMMPWNKEKYKFKLYGMFKPIFGSKKGEQSGGTRLALYDMYTCWYLSG